MWETIFLGHDNVIDLLLTSDGDVANIINTVRATAEFGGTVIDSDTSASAFDWSEGDGILHLIMGEETIPTGSYKAVITLYDSVNTDGIVWDDFRCRVVGEELVPIPDTPPPILISQGGTGQATAYLAFNALKQAATETYTGVTELATSAECVTGTDTSRAVTPSGLAAHTNNYVNRDGTLALIADWDIGDGRDIRTDKIRARDEDGLILHDDGGNGMVIKDGGNVCIGGAFGWYKLDVDGDIMAKSSNGRILGFYNFVSGHTVHFRYGGDPSNEIETTHGAEAKFKSYYGTKFYRGWYTNNYEIARIGISDTSDDSYFVGNVGVDGTTAPTAAIDINSDILRIRAAKTPATSGAAGNQGDVCWDADYVYVCTATNTWKRSAIATW